MKTAEEVTQKLKDSLEGHEENKQEVVAVSPINDFGESTSAKQNILRAAEQLMSCVDENSRSDVRLVKLLYTDVYGIIKKEY